MQLKVKRLVLPTATGTPTNDEIQGATLKGEGQTRKSRNGKSITELPVDNLSHLYLLIMIS
ncbi:hypothetical protein H0A36_27515 [Endozoicomonas sp. SM1973]|uniref:Uncharacterized protein n=1 Tax=Spartinivicinus marinus TaxID=2994442 RepID=A0A853IL16_9GAMM|nr:hypothetical protein [Spartinivicinus marinus]NYZ69765.1 hypothetical protein [Spartinivicinus marinus]